MPVACLARALVLFTATALSTAAGSCGLETILIDSPRDAQLIDEPSPTLHAAARVGDDFLVPSMLVRIDGTELTAALRGCRPSAACPAWS